MFNLLNALVTGAIDANSSDEQVILMYLESQNMSFFDILYTRYSGKVLAKCITILKDTDHAKDAMQDIFMKVMLSIGGFKHEAKFSTWLYRITYNFCIDETRRLKKLNIANDASFDYISETEAYEDNIDESRVIEVEVLRMKEILDLMKVEDKTILLMKYQDDLQIKEICDILDKSESAIKMQLKRAKEKFIQIHEQNYKEYGIGI